MRKRAIALQSPRGFDTPKAGLASRIPSFTLFLSLRGVPMLFIGTTKQSSFFII
jgi:hypothetical protein